MIMREENRSRVDTSSSGVGPGLACAPASQVMNIFLSAVYFLLSEEGVCVCVCVFPSADTHLRRSQTHKQSHAPTAELVALLLLCSTRHHLWMFYTLPMVAMEAGPERRRRRRKSGETESAQ